MPASTYILSYVEREDSPLVPTFDEDTTADLIILHSIKKVCGVEIDDDTVEFTSFLGSMDSVLLVSEINKNYPKAGLIKLADLLNSKTVKDLVILLQNKLLSQERRIIMRAQTGLFTTKDLELGAMNLE